MPSEQPPSTTGKILAVIGAILSMVPLFSVAYMAIAMFHAVQAVERTSETHDPSVFQSYVSNAFYFTMASFPLGVIGGVLSIIAIAGFRYHAEWLWWTLFLSFLCWLSVFPFGTACGSLVVIFLLLKRKQFSQNEKA